MFTLSEKFLFAHLLSSIFSNVIMLYFTPLLSRLENFSFTGSPALYQHAFHLLDGVGEKLHFFPELSFKNLNNSQVDVQSLSN
jgi:hypothetical protein